MYALNVTECLVTGKKSRATFSTNQKRNENLFVCASSFDWFIRLFTYAVFYFFHTRLMYWLFTICLWFRLNARIVEESSAKAAIIWQQLFNDRDDC